MTDIGCGDGKYFGVNPNVVCIGCDRSSVLLQVSDRVTNIWLITLSYLGIEN